MIISSNIYITSRFVLDIDTTTSSLLFKNGKSNDRLGCNKDNDELSHIFYGNKNLWCSSVFLKDYALLDYKKAATNLNNRNCFSFELINNILDKNKVKIKETKSDIYFIDSHAKYKEAIKCI